MQCENIRHLFTKLLCPFVSDTFIGVFFGDVKGLLDVIFHSMLGHCRSVLEP